ncbi:hypothetical protein ACP4OV_014261 [Aristida adscensionis]
MEEHLVAVFMEITGLATCEDAAHHLNLCSGNLEQAVDLFFSIGAGPSGSRSPPPPPPPPSSSGRVSRWGSDTRVSYRGGRDDAIATPDDGDVDGSRGRRSRRRRRRQRRRRQTRQDDGTSDGDREVDGGDRRRRRRISNEDGVVSGDVMLVEPPSPPPPATAKMKEKATTVDGHGGPSPPPLHEVAYRGGGGLHGAVVEAARRARWLLVNVHARGEPASELQSRDVWADELVARCVGDHFVLWQVDANAAAAAGGDGDDEEEEAKKVCCYYRLPRHGLPAAVVVDPVTGAAMDVILRGDAVKPKDFLKRVGAFTDTKPIMPAIAGHAQSNQEPTIAVAPTSSERTAGGQEPASPVRKAVTEVVSAAAAKAAPPEIKVCKLRVRLPDGRVVAKEFGIRCAVSALFAYCRSELGEGEAAERPFRLMRFVNGAREEIGDHDTAFGDLGLHLSTVSLLLG